MSLLNALLVMKKKSTTTVQRIGIMGALCLSFFNNGFSQNATSTGAIPTKTMSNGVIVHEAVGVEGIVVESAEPVQKSLSISDWSESMCIETLDIFRLKVQEPITEEEKQNYIEQVKLIEERLLILKAK